MNNAHFRAPSTYIRYKLGNPIPFLVILMVTLKCNLSCDYCSTHAVSNRLKERGDMPASLIRKVLREMKKMGMPIVSFSGGEPLLHKDLVESLRYAKKMRLAVNLNTNGHLVNEINASDISRYTDYIRVSLDDLNDFRARNAIKLLSSKFLGINTIYYPGREKIVHQIIREHIHKVDHISVLPRFSFVQKDDFKVVDSHFAQSLKKYGNKVNSEFVIHSADYYRKICDYGKLYLAIYPSGSIVGCPFLGTKEYEIANSNEISLSDIDYRSIEKPPCIGCYATCTTEISKLFQSNIIELAMKISQTLLKG